MDVQVIPEADFAAPESDQSDRIKPWTIKGIPIEIRNAAISAADRDGLPIGKWFERNIPAIIQQNRQQTRVTVVADQPVTPSDPKADLEEIKGVIAIARDLQEVSGDPLPEDVRKLGYDLVRGRLKALKRGGQTRRGKKSDAQVGEV
jgi:hypothetical protein